jgi:hypothetical protein
MPGDATVGTATEMALRVVVRSSNSAERHLGGHGPPDRGGTHTIVVTTTVVH